MPKRGGRGDRGRGRGRGRGGFGGRGGFNKKRSGKRGSQGFRGGRPGSGPPPGFQEDVMMLDIGGGPSVHMPKENTMRFAARRTRRPRLQDEAFNTDENRDSTLNLPLRLRPIVFVKADSYDPTKDVINGLREKEEQRLKPEPSQDSEVAEDAPIETLPVEVVEEEHEVEETFEEPKEQHHPSPPPVQDPTPQKPKKIKAKVNKLAQVPDDLLFFVDETPTEPTNVKTVDYTESKPPAVNPWSSGAGPNTEFNPTLSIGHVHLSLQQDDEGQLQTSISNGKGPKPQKLEEFDPEAVDNADEDEELEELEDQILGQPNGRNPQMYEAYQKYINRVMGNMFGEDDSGDDDEEDDDGEGIYDELDDDFEEEAKFIAGVEDDDEEMDDETAADMNNLQIDAQEEDSDPEFGFLEEDYETFDHTLVEVINIRYGSTSNQYHMKSFRLTGTYDHQWISQDLFEEFLTENGMPEHRLDAYFKYLKNMLTPQEEEEKNYDDIPISDSSEEEGNQHDDYDDSDDDQLGDSDMEGLDDLIQYTKKYDGKRDMDVEPTRTLKTRGKGKKKELDLEGVSSDLADRLHEQWQLRRDGKKDRKKRREETIASEHAKSKDLLLKYPYTLHIKNIRDEFEEFLNDSKRNALTFPPMDPHGIKVVQKFAYLYNMKARKFGQGLKTHAVAVKNKRTFRSLPDYHSISMLMKQRPVFNRIDQKRPKAEIDAEKSSRRGVPSKAHVKEGDIVGADAPEIASDNVGRKLLMKMGWKSGQGLGMDNRGIPEPVIAKIKKTKIGIR